MNSEALRTSITVMASAGPTVPMGPSQQVNGTTADRFTFRIERA
ncbi:MAG TPA: hypothetical protein VGR55_01695 [Candidatus Acidoferrum sp.]|nr:hypothetical protein [Candidatus Acidoferrum sp.]